MLDGLRWAARPLARAGWEMGRDAGGIGPALCYAVGYCAALAALILFMRRNADSMSAFLNAAVLRPGLFRRALLLACLLMLAAGSIDLAQAPAPLLNAQPMPGCGRRGWRAPFPAGWLCRTRRCWCSPA
ncbi:Uncharacterised protein [Chromobacterium violaceum]|uniref:Uncharacterized protein n=1 Tax=Chromobacterium violaceum TaxID=536 RepID=A0A3S4LIM0_CHRVL|nr:Uncharacterised protein [Chromobacterium violaceum]